MSPRLPSAITSMPARRAWAQTFSKAAKPTVPSASKNASCGLTATACGATASTIPQQKRATSPRSSTGSRSGRGSSPTTIWLRLRSTSAASRSANASVATAIPRQGSRLRGCLNDRGPRRRGPRSNLTLRPVSALERRLELAARRELRHRRRGDVDALSGTRVHALTRCTLGGRELAEAGEADRVAALQPFGHDFHERLDGLAGIAVLEPALLRDLRDEVLFRQNLLLTVGYGSRPRA